MTDDTEAAVRRCVDSLVVSVNCMSRADSCDAAPRLVEPKKVGGSRSRRRESRCRRTSVCDPASPSAGGVRATRGGAISSTWRRSRSGRATSRDSRRRSGASGGCWRGGAWSSCCRRVINPTRLAHRHLSRCARCTARATLTHPSERPRHRWRSRSTGRRGTRHTGLARSTSRAAACSRCRARPR